MAENQNDENKPQEDENDPYKFFKFPGPQDNDDKDKNKDKKNKNGKKKFPFVLILFLTLFVVAMAEYFIFPKNDDLIDYSDFKAKIERGEIKSVVISDSYFIGYGTVIETDVGNGKGLKLFNVPSAKAAIQYKTSAVLTQSFLDFLEENNIHYKFAAKQNNWFLQLLLNLIVPFGLIFLMYFFLFRKMGGGSGGGGIGSIFSVGNSRAKVVEEGKIKTRFSDVAGVDEAKEELVEVVDFLKTPKKYTDIGGKIPKGVLLVGDPGTGKTLLARAVAGEAGVPFFSI